MIAHVTSELLNVSVGGIGSLLNEMIATSDDTKVEFILVVDERINKKPTPTENQKNIIILSVDEYTNYQFQEKYKKIYFHNFFLFKKCPNIPTAVVCHSNLLIELKYEPWTISPEMKSIQCHVFLQCDEIVFVSNFDLNESLEAWENDPRLNLLQKQNLRSKPKCVIPNGIRPNPAPDHMKKHQEWKKLSENKKTWTFGYIGRLSQRKGIFELVEHFPNSDTLLIASGGANRYHPISETILAKSLESRNTKNVIPIGYCSQKRKNDFFSKVDAIILPSLYEPFGMTVLEALNFGVPILCKKNGGPLEILGADYPFFYAENSQSDLKDVIEKFKNDFSKTSDDFLKLAHQVLSSYDVKNTSQLYLNHDTTFYC